MDFVFQLVAGIIADTVGAIGTSILDSRSLVRNRKRWEQTGGPALRARVIAGHAGALVFTAALHSSWNVTLTKDWVVVIADRTSIRALRSSDELAWEMPWTRVHEVLRNHSGAIAITSSGGTIQLTPVTTAGRPATRRRVDEIVTRMLAKRTAAAGKGD